MKHGLHYIEVGRFSVCWRDAWTGRYGFEFAWGTNPGQHFQVGF